MSHSQNGLDSKGPESAVQVQGERMDDKKSVEGLERRISDIATAVGQGDFDKVRYALFWSALYSTFQVMV